MYDHPTPGLKIHLRYMHFDLDPRSVRYLRPPAEDDIIDTDRAYQFGSHRIPTGTIARHDFLWRAIPVELGVGPEREISVRATGEYGTVEADTNISHVKDLMLAAGDFFNAVSVEDSIASINDDDYSHNLYASPIWQESTSVYFQLACKIPYLRQIRGIYSILAMMAMEVMTSNWEIQTAVLEFHKYLVKRPAPWSLRETVEKGRHYKAKGDDLFQDYGKSGPAAAMYIRAIGSILPWFPSDYYMSPWEARASGIGGLLIKCNINLALALMVRWTTSPYAIHTILESASQLSCVTNWEMAKIRHLQALCAKYVQIKNPHVSASDMRLIVRANPIPKYSVLLTQSKTYLGKPPGRLANTPWIGDFSSKHFRDHYVELREKVPATSKNSETRWWRSIITPQTIRIAEWLRRMQDLSAEHKEKMKGEADRDDLAVDNGRLDQASEGKQVWEFRV